MGPGAGSGMTDEAGILQAIVADPTDDLPRLVYADWLDDNDQPARADLIRIQVELARLTAAGRTRRRPANTIRFAELRARERMLLGPPGPPGDQLGRQWALPTELATLWPQRVGGWDWDRGFPEFWWCPLHLWLKWGAAIAVRTPVQRVTVMDREPAPTRSHPTSASRCWYRGDESQWTVPPPGRAVLPGELFDSLPLDPFDLELLDTTRTYPNADAAHEALSAACVGWARTAAPEFVSAGDAN